VGPKKDISVKDDKKINEINIEKAPIDLLQAVQTGAKDKSQSEQGEIKTTKKSGRDV